MCEKRIEKAGLGVHGVSKADWNKETKKMELVFDDAKTDLDKIEIAIVRFGHYTPKQKAPDEVYKKLPECSLFRK